MMSILTDSFLVLSADCRKKNLFQTCYFFCLFHMISFHLFFPYNYQLFKGRLELSMPCASESAMILLQPGYVLCLILSIVQKQKSCAIEADES